VPGDPGLQAVVGGVKAVGVDLVDAEPLVPVIQDEIEVLPTTPRLLVTAAGDARVLAILFPALIGHPDCGAT
jgi:hypothetical protein